MSDYLGFVVLLIGLGVVIWAVFRRAFWYFIPHTHE